MKRLLTAAVLSAVLVAATPAPADAHRRRANPPARVRANPAGQINGHPCGGSLPPCYVLHRESRGNPVAQNRRSTASGLWQFLDSTWARHSGYRKARFAPVAVQNEKARLLWAGGRGCRHWRACR